MSRQALAVVSSIALLTLASCALPGGGTGGEGVAHATVTPGPTPTHAPGVHNLIEVSPGVYSGSMPEGDAGFGTLASLGVKTVISVDAARPDIERARERDMRYVHVPVEYAGIDRDERWDLARALRDLPRPIYVHCHHGKHRGPTAAVVGLELTGELSPDGALALMDAAGTSPEYPGLWQCAREASPISTAALDAWQGAWPEVADVGGFVEAMATIDRAYGRIRLTREAGWATPADHPDLVPAALAGQVADVFRALSEQTDEPAFTAADLVAGLRAAGGHASDLERALIAGDHAGAEASWALVVAGCNGCHEAHRNGD